MSAPTIAPPRAAVHCYGDSHVWAMTAARPHLPHVELHVVGVGGATALGLANPNSATNALNVFRASIVHVPRDQPLVLMLGEIDCGFLAWIRAAERGTTVEAELETSLTCQRRFLAELSADGRRRLHVVSVPLPSVADYTTWRGLANARCRVTATLPERTAVTRWFNARLRTAASDDGIGIVDVEHALLDPGTGLLAERFRHPDPDDHHYDRAAFGEVLAAGLRDAGLA